MRDAAKAMFESSKNVIELGPSEIENLRAGIPRDPGLIKPLNHVIIGLVSEAREKLAAGRDYHFEKDDLCEGFIFRNADAEINEMTLYFIIGVI